MTNDIHSNVKYITSGKIPAISELPKGNMAFGKMDIDGCYHVYGNPNGDAIIDLSQQYLNFRLERYYTSTQIDEFVAELGGDTGRPLVISRPNLDFIDWVDDGEGGTFEKNIIVPDNIQINKGMDKAGYPVDATGFACAFCELPRNYTDITFLGGPAFNSTRFTITFHDKTQKYISWLEWQTYNYPIPMSSIPAGTQYIGITWQMTSGIEVEYNVRYTVPKILYPIDTELRVLAENIVGDILPQTYSKYHNKKMAVLGCSLTQAEGYTSWHSHVKESLGLSEVYNYGLGWSIVGETTTPYYNPNTVVADERKPMVIRALDMPDDADIVVAFPGTGEMVWNIALGTIDDPLTNANGLSLTFYSSLKRLASILTGKYRYSKIIFILTLQQSNKLGNEHRKAVREVAELYGITVCDTTKSRLNFYTMNASDRAVVTPDGIHMTDEGHRRLAYTLTNTILYE